MLTQGKGCVWQKQLYKYGCRGGAPPESLGEFADDTNQGCVLILEPLVVSPKVRQGLQLLLQFGCLSLQGPALESLQLQKGRPLCKALLLLRGALQVHLELRQLQGGLRQGLAKALVLTAQLGVQLPEASVRLVRFRLWVWVEILLPAG